MVKSKVIEDLARAIQDVFPEGLDQVRGDLGRNVRAAISSALTRMDLVGREEFDVQTQVLAKTRAKVEALEKQVSELESELSPSRSERSRSGRDPD